MSNKYCYISNFSEDRIFFKKEFEKFGEIRKIYVESSGQFAKVYFKDPHCCHLATNNFKNNLFGWKVIVQEDPYIDNSFRNNFNNKEQASYSENNSNMYDDYDDMFAQSLSSQYCNVHGRPIELLEDEDSGETYVNLKDMEKAGFRIFNHSEYARFLRFRDEDRLDIIMEDFTSFLLAQAAEYLLEHSITIIKHQDILDTINKCKNILGLDAAKDSRSQNRRVSNHSYENNNVSVRVNAQEIGRDFSQISRNQFNRGVASPRLKLQSISAESIPQMRLPKKLASNFVPTQRYSAQNNRNQRETRNDNFDSRNQREGRNDNFDSPRSQSRRQQYDNEEFRDNKFAGQRQNGFRKQEQRPATDPDKFKDNEPVEQKQNRHRRQHSRDSIAPTSDTTQQKHFDTLSQASDSSTGKKPSLMKSLESADVIAHVNLESDKTYNVQISHVEKENICWVQEIEVVKDLEDLLLEMDESASEIESVKNITKGKLVLAQYEEAWCRSRVIDESTLNVLFIDYGNKETVEAVKELPAKFRKMPAVANRLVISNCNLTLENEMTLKIKIKQQYEDGTYLVNLEQPSFPQNEVKNEVPPKTQEPIVHSEEKKEIATSSKTSKSPQPTAEKHFFNMPKPLAEIKNKDKVMLTGLVNNKFAVKTKECTQRSKIILEYIKSLDKSELMLTSVKEGQLVLCSKDGLPSLCRAIVKKKDSPTIVTVRYLDFYGEEQLSIKSLRNVDEYLANEPITLLFTPPLEVLECLTEKSTGFIDNLLANKEKANVELTEDNDFDLQFEDGNFLSSTLLKLEKPKQEEEKKMSSDPPKTSTPATNNVSKTEESQIKPTEKSEVVSTKTEEAPSQKSEVNGPITYNDMSFINTDVGTTGTYICYTITDLTEVTFISMTDECLAYLTQVSCLDVEDDKPFEPEVGDMCLVSYQCAGEDEPSWYRAVTIDKEAEDFVLTTVDFGSQVTTQSKNIRRFPSNLKDIPILGILCSIGNVENNEKNLARVKELIPEMKEVEVFIKEFVEDEFKYIIEIPELANI